MPRPSHQKGFDLASSNCRFGILLRRGVKGLFDAKNATHPAALERSRATSTAVLRVAKRMSSELSGKSLAALALTFIKGGRRRHLRQNLC
mmetsp:Transcript_159402/g.511431  ORF Transcript_159402/g.511431 Transcript_159402/m.511431 type:complete len:90 (-) Transcript_159402:12-281(-)